MKSKGLFDDGKESNTPPSKLPKVWSKQRHHSTESPAVSKLRSRAVCVLRKKNDFVGSFVFTPRFVDEKGVVIPPPDWQTNPKLVCTETPDFPSTSDDPDDYNNSVTDVTEIAWLIAGISHVKVAVFDSKILELLQLFWKPCWVPLHMVSINSERLKAELEREKKKYSGFGELAKGGLRRTIPAHVRKVLALYHLTKETSFLIRQVNKYAIITVPELGNNVEVIKADFIETYEHSSALFTNKELWKELCKRRIEAAEALLKTETTSKVLQEFIEKNTEDLKKLTEEF